MEKHGGLRPKLNLKCGGLIQESDLDIRWFDIYWDETGCFSLNCMMGKFSGNPYYIYIYTYIYLFIYIIYIYDGKTMVSCKISRQPIRWVLRHDLWSHGVTRGLNPISHVCHWGEGQFLQEAKLLNIVSQTSLELKLWNCKNWPRPRGSPTPRRYRMILWMSLLKDNEVNEVIFWFYLFSYDILRPSGCIKEVDVCIPKLEVVLRLVRLALGFSPGFPTWRTAAGASLGHGFMVCSAFVGDIGVVPKNGSRNWTGIVSDEYWVNRLLVNGWGANVWWLRLLAVVLSYLLFMCCSYYMLILFWLDFFCSKHARYGYLLIWKSDPRCHYAFPWM
jgi:hypothetical protein